MKPSLLAICLAAVIAVNFSSNAKAAGPPLVNVVVIDTKIPVQVISSELTCPAGPCLSEVYTVPPGKRFVMEFMTLHTQILPRDSGQSAVAIIQAEFDGVFYQHAVGVTTNTGTGLNTADVFAGPIKVYAQSESQVFCGGAQPAAEEFRHITCTMTGYLENE